jgi:hypothetical protein
MNLKDILSEKKISPLLHKLQKRKYSYSAALKEKTAQFLSG